ncbi:MAG: sulfurtransferase TusA family protein [Desulfocurvibacter africanus]
MTKVVDARGLSCPQPVMKAQEAIKAGDFPIKVLVDTVTSRENVRRMAEHQGCQVEITQDEDEFHLIITRR